MKSDDEVLHEAVRLLQLASFQATAAVGVAWKVSLNSDAPAL